MEGVPIGGAGGGVGFDSLVTTQQGGVRNVALIAQSMNTMVDLVAAISTAFTSISGTQGGLTLANATLTIVTTAAMNASSVVIITATNSAAASTLSVNGLFVAAKTAGLSFTLSTRVGAAGGTEKFDYTIFG